MHTCINLIRFSRCENNTVHMSFNATQIVRYVQWMRERAKEIELQSAFWFGLFSNRQFSSSSLAQCCLCVDQLRYCACETSIQFS